MTDLIAIAQRIAEEWMSNCDFSTVYEDDEVRELRLSWDEMRAIQDHILTARVTVD